jgi:hypothetical protein
VCLPYVPRHMVIGTSLPLYTQRRIVIYQYCSHFRRLLNMGMTDKDLDASVTQHRKRLVIWRVLGYVTKISAVSNSCEDSFSSVLAVFWRNTVLFVKHRISMMFLISFNKVLFKPGHLEIVAGNKRESSLAFRGFVLLSFANSRSRPTNINTSLRPFST